MTQRIHLAAILQKDGKLLLVRSQIGEPWALPGRLFGDDAEDMDATMAAELLSFGVTTPNIEEDFFETVFLGQPEERLVFNIYAPAEWGGEARAPSGADIGWFSVEALAGIDMEPPIRDAVLQAFGLQPRPDAASQIAEALQAAEPDVPALLPDPPVEPQAADVETHAAASVSEPAAASRTDRGLDVLATLNAGDPAAEARLRETFPELADDILGALGDTWARPVIDRKTRSLQVVAMLAALGKSGALRTHMLGALNHGASPDQVVETIRTVAVYAGFPAALEAWSVMEEVFAARGIARPRGGV